MYGNHKQFAPRKNSKTQLRKQEEAIHNRVDRVNCAFCGNQFATLLKVAPESYVCESCYTKVNKKEV